jgi:hypothetical protein
MIFIFNEFILYINNFSNHVSLEKHEFVRFVIEIAIAFVFL